MPLKNFRSITGLLLLCLPNLFAQSPVITTVAGTEWIFPGDGKPALNAPLGGAAYVTVDSNGNLVVSDSTNAVVFRVNPDGKITVLAGNGLKGHSGDGGPAVNASLNQPQGIAFDTHGNLFIADAGNHRIRKVNHADGVITTFAGTGVASSTGDGGPASRATLNYPIAIAIDFTDTLYVSDIESLVIRRINPDGIVNRWAGTTRAGNDTGENVRADSVSLGRIPDLAVDSKGNLFFPDEDNNKVRRIDRTGNIVTVLAPGVLNHPFGIAVDRTSGDIYVSDGYNNVIRKIDAQNAVSIFAGTGKFGFSGDGGNARNAVFQSLTGLVVDAARNVYIADRDNFRVRKVNAAGTISTVAGSGTQARGAPEGSASSRAFFAQPRGIAFDSRGNLFIADTANNRVRVIASNGSIRTIAGTGAKGYDDAPLPATSSPLDTPHGVTPFRDEVYIANTNSNVVQKVDTRGNLFIIAGNGAAGFAGENVKATAASLNQPVALAFDDLGNLYISDSFNNRIRKVDTNGVITTFAGDGQFRFAGENVPARQASLATPSGLVFYSGDLYVADRENRLIRRITSTGIITTFAGGGLRQIGPSDSFPARQAAIGKPIGITADSAGNIYFADDTNRVYRVNPAGSISLAAGNGDAAFAGDGGPALLASLHEPVGLAVNSAGDLLIADSLNDRIRSVVAARPSFNVSPPTLAFTAKSGAALTESQDISVSGSLTGLLYAVALDGGNWLRTTTIAGSSPAAVRVFVDPTGVEPGTYRATVVITSPGANPSTRSIPVTFSVAQPEVPKLDVSSKSLTFSFVAGSAGSSQDVAVLNTGTGTLNFSATSSIDSGENWLSVTSGGSSTPVQPSPVTVAVNPAGLDPGTYTGSVVVAGEGTSSSTIRVIVTVLPVPKKLVLSQSGLTFTAESRGGAPLPQSFGVLNAGQVDLDWTVKVTPLSGGDNWLVVTPDAGTSRTGNTDIPSIYVALSAADLDAGTYQARIQVFSPSADNSPQTVTVTFNVLAPGADPGPEVRPSGLIFTGPAGSSPSSQNVYVANPGSRVIDYTSTRITSDGRPWFKSEQDRASVAPDQPARIVVQPDFTGLGPGTYEGQLTLRFGSTTRTVSVLSIVTGPSAAPALRQQGLGPKAVAAATGTCNGGKPSDLSVSVSSLQEKFTVTVGQGITIEVKALDSCGKPLPSPPATSMILLFSNGDRQLDLFQSGPSTWSQTWTPGSVGPVKMAVKVVTSIGGQPLGYFHPETPLTGTVSTPKVATPLVASEKIRNSASFVEWPLIAPGGLITVFGENLADGACDPTISQPVALEMGGAQVLLDDKPLALLFACNGQINAQVPYEMSATDGHQLQVRYNKGESIPIYLTVAKAQPAIFTTNQQGTGQGSIYATDGNGNLRDLAKPGTPVRAGDIVTIYCTGLGGVTGSVELARPAPSNAKTKEAVLVRIGGKVAQLLNSGLEPDNPAGRYMVQVVVPAGVTGDEVPVILTVAGQNSPPVTMAVR